MQACVQLSGQTAGNAPMGPKHSSMTAWQNRKEFQNIGHILSHTHILSFSREKTGKEGGELKNSNKKT